MKLWKQSQKHIKFIMLLLLRIHTLHIASNKPVLSVTYRSLVAKIICPFETGENFMELFHHSSAENVV